MKEEPPSLKICMHMESAVHWAYSYFKDNETMLWGIRAKVWDFSFDQRALFLAFRISCNVLPILRFCQGPYGHEDLE